MLEQRVADLERWRREEETRAAERAMWRMWWQVNAATMLVIGALTFVGAKLL